MKEDEREEKELRAYMASALAAEINNLLPRQQTSGRPDEQKTPSSMQDAPVDLVAARQRSPGQSGPDRSQDGR
jgi:peptide-N4-(N-acetyl-beta-glucosaminyl)asparagine amidase